MRLSSLRIRRVRARPRMLQPDGARMAYLSELRALVALMRALVHEHVLPVVDAEVRAGRARADSAADINRALDRASRELYRRITTGDVARIVRLAAKQTSAFHRAQLAQQVADGIGVDPRIPEPPPARVQAFVAENVAQVKSIVDRFFSEVETRVTRAVRAGESTAQVAAEVNARADVASERAKLVARDELGGWYAELQETRQKALGVDRYVWRTSQDSRVREVHQERDGNVYEWANPPGDASDPHDGGHPGEGINCRCTAVPYLEDLEA